MIPASAPAQERVPIYAWYVVVLLTLVNVVNYMDRMALSVLLPSIKADLRLSDTELGLLTGLAFALFYAAFGIPMARWADRGTRRTVISVAMAVWSVMTVLAGAAQSFLHLFLARVGVGIGEAGCIPPSQSLISDYIPIARRSGALALHTTGAYIGLTAGLVLGGWLGTVVGWRLTFVALGVPGVLMSVLVYKTVREPPRGSVDGLEDLPAPRLSETGPYLWRRKSFVQIALLCGLSSFSQFGLAQWQPSFYTRSFGMNIADVGKFFGVTYGIGSILGTLIGGFAANRLTKRDARWGMWLGAASYVASLPIGVAMFLGSAAAWSLWLNFLYTVLCNVVSAPLFALLHAVVMPRMRAMAVSVAMFSAAVLGIGGGPFFVGALSDALAPAFGQESLRYALAATAAVTVLPAVNCLLAARHIRSDLAAVRTAPM